jgi:hypothetical protein
MQQGGMQAENPESGSGDKPSHPLPEPMISKQGTPDKTISHFPLLLQGHSKRAAAETAAGEMQVSWLVGTWLPGQQ